MKCISISFLCLFLGLFSTSCASTDEGSGDEIWAELTVKAPSTDVLWQMTRLALQKEQLPVQTRFDSKSGEATTGWQTSLAPFKGDGYRERALVRYEALGDGSYEIEARVVRQSNECLARPLDISYAKWKGAPDNEARAKILLQRIRAYLGDDGGFEVGEKPNPFK